MIRVGTRSSQLAQAQTRIVLDELHEQGHDAKPVPIQTLGDANQRVPIHHMGTAGAFTQGLAWALLNEDIDLAVHSLKDLPIEPIQSLTIAAILPRGPPQDVLLVNPNAHADKAPLPIKENARVATSGPRRQSQLLHARPDLTILNVRGNVDTRIQKLREGWFDALVTARVALDRMHLTLDDIIPHDLPPQQFPPAPGQAAIAIQAREGSKAARIAQHLDHAPTREAVETERRLLNELGGGCGLPLGAWAHRTDEAWTLTATFAGHGWTPAHQPHIHHEQRTSPEPDALPEHLLAPLQAIQPTEPHAETHDDPPNDGETVLVVASEPTARTWKARLRAHGYQGHAAPTRRFTHADPPTDERLDALHRADWIALTSRHAIPALTRAFPDEPPDAYTAAVGPNTAKALQREGFPCHLVPPQATGQRLAEAIHRLAHGTDRVLLVQSDTTHGDAHRHLARTNLDLDTWTAYHTHEHTPNPDALPLDLPADYALVMSPRNAHTLPPHDPHRLAATFIAIGPTTADALREEGLKPRTAKTPTIEAVLDQMETTP